MSLSEETHQAAARPAPGIPLSLQQEFLCAMDKGDEEGSFGTKHIIASAWRLSGPVDTELLRRALDDVVERHEMLRTSIVRDGDERSQVVHPPSPVRLLIRELSGEDPDTRDRVAEEFFNEVESGTYRVSELPHLRAAVGRFDEGAVLVLVVHHVACDGWSMRVIMRDLTRRYAALRGHPGTGLPEWRQYQEYVSWQQGTPSDPGTRRSLEYWGEQLRDARIAAVTADRPRSAGLPTVYSTHRFVIDAEVTSGVLKLARAMRCSPFMVLIAVYNVIMHREAGVDDVVVSTFTSGRDHEGFHDSVGAFLNFVPLRSDVGACGTFAELLERTRATCIDALTHDVPFVLIEGAAPELMAPFMEDDLDVIAFEVLQFPEALDGELIGDVKYTEMRRRVRSQPVSSDIPDGALWALDILPSGEMIGSLKYNSARFDESTMWRLIAAYDRVLRNAVGDPNISLAEI